MSELRWTLLILGVVFVAALTWWERRRPRQAFAPRLREAGASHFESHRGGSTSATPPAEPWIGESALSDVVSAEMTFAGEPHNEGRGMERSLESQGPGPLEELPTLVLADADERLALEGEALSAERPGTTPGSLRSTATKSEEVLGHGALPPWMATAAPPEPKLIDPEANVAMEILEPTRPIEPPRAAPPTAPAPSEPAARATAPSPPAPMMPPIVPASPIVDWPPEGSRRILALRLVAPATERFPGRSLRLALAAEGFLLGKFSIFHKPDEMNRAVLSAASLTRPGAFDLETMDSQRYSGVALFAVLPGPTSPPQAFEELLGAARNLNDRLQGALQDERGGPLTPLRVAGLRESLRAEAATLPAASGE